ncbi:hypothetical protein Tco_0523204 [Tanacetum coccineum]
MVGTSEISVLSEKEKTEGPMQSSSVLSDFASQFLNLDNALPNDNEIISMMNVELCHTVLWDNFPQFILFTTDLSQFKQVDHSAQLLAIVRSQVPAMLTQAKNDRYIDFIKKSIKDIIKDEVKSQLPQILPNEVSDFATPVIQSTINESLENVVLAKSSSQPKSTYEVAASLTEFELKKIILDKMQKTKSYRKYPIKRDREDKDKDEDPPAGSDQGLKTRKTSKDAEPSKGYKSKESKSISSKGTKSQLKSSGTCKSHVELEYNFEECNKAVTGRLDWNNPEGSLEDTTDPSSRI